MFKNNREKTVVMCPLMLDNNINFFHFVIYVLFSAELALGGLSYKLLVTTDGCLTLFIIIKLGEASTLDKVTAAISS